MYVQKSREKNPSSSYCKITWNTCGNIHPIVLRVYHKQVQEKSKHTVVVIL